MPNVNFRFDPAQGKWVVDFRAVDNNLIRDIAQRNFYRNLHEGIPTQWTYREDKAPSETEDGWE